MFNYKDFQCIFLNKCVSYCTTNKIEIKFVLYFQYCLTIQNYSPPKMSVKMLKMKKVAGIIITTCTYAVNITRISS